MHFLHCVEFFSVTHILVFSLVNTHFLSTTYMKCTSWTKKKNVFILSPNFMIVTMCVPMVNSLKFWILNVVSKYLSIFMYSKSVYPSTANPINNIISKFFNTPNLTILFWYTNPITQAWKFGLSECTKNDGRKKYINKFRERVFPGSFHFFYRI